ncbi:hypothetical protein VTK73DRAFT_4937 [Phialemonium thermophilum]|uniref:cyclin-dependent kinase n=1 Tax=Phialemonium thermophilum TaxID=223376 RepID=A0ABR3WRE6_9PEZI
MASSETTQCRTRDAAMPDAHLSHGDSPHSRSTRDDRGMPPLSRSSSPAAAAAAAAAAGAVGATSAPPRHSHHEAPTRDNRPPSPSDRSHERPTNSGGSEIQRYVRGFSRERPAFPDESYRRRPRDDSRGRARPGASESDIDLQSRHPPAWQDRDPLDRNSVAAQRAFSRSPSSAKRARSPSPYARGSRPKKSRRGRSPRRPGNGPPRSSHPPPPKSYRNPSSPPRRPRSPERRGRQARPRRRQDYSQSPGTTPRDRASASPTRPRRPSRTDHPSFADSDAPSRRRSRSPPPHYHHHHPRSRSRQRRPTSRGSRPPTSSDTASHRRASPDYGPYEAPYPPSRSPRDRGPKPGKKGRIRDKHPSSSKRFDPTSGANSIEVSMSARGGGYRGGFHPPVQPAFQGAHDSRAYSRSSGHATPNSSYHGSPPPHSPYAGNGRSWGGHQQYPPQQYSPQQQYPPPQYPHGSYGPPNGTQGHFSPNQGHAMPYPAHGPASHPQGSYQGHQRGSPAGFRGGGGPFGSGRGGRQAGGFKSSQWNAALQNAHSPGQGSGGDEGHPSRPGSHASPSRSDQALAQADDKMELDSENLFRPLNKDLQVEDTVNQDASDEQQPMLPPPARPPTGPQSSSKFSFAFKASKPAVSGPKPEISSKFNAAPSARRDPLQNSEAERSGLPRNVPTEPASARPSRGQEPRSQPPPPEPTPRVRKVKKIMRRLKPRPTLSPDLAASESVFFRKPGNESVVGSGTYGKVFKGLNVYTKNLVALKRIRMEGERDGFPVTAVREIKLLQSLRHINIVQLQEVMVEKNDCFMVFEYLSHDLTGLLNHPTFKLDAAQKKHLAKQMFEALDYLHKRGVLHRDIKAANILVSSDGILKLADFGLARFYAKRHQLDYTNRVITIWYRSPELLLGETQYGPAVDIWSAACVMVEIFMRHAIFPGDGSEISQLDKIYSVLGTPTKTDWPNLIEMPWFELLRPGYRKPNVFAEKYKDRFSPAAFDLLAAMLRYDPAKRLTAAEVLEHPYFTTEEPAPRQAVELRDLDGDWHEFESKALRRENERKEKEAKRAMAKEAAAAAAAVGPTTASSGGRERERKRTTDLGEAHRDPKRQHASTKPAPGDQTQTSAGPMALG